MKIEYNSPYDLDNTIDIEVFADKHDLIMVVGERRSKELPTYYAYFKYTDFKGDGVLIGSFGNGETPDEAIDDYISIISNTTLVINGFKDNRREIKVPTLTKSKIYGETKND
jgi:hypothetical protein